MMTTVVEEGFASATGGDRVATFGGLFVGFILSTTLYGQLGMRIFKFI